MSTTPTAIIHRLVDANGGVDAIARKIRGCGIVTQMNAPVLRKWLGEPRDFEGIDPVTRTSRLIESTGSLLPLHWLCGRLGCHFVYGPEHFEGVVGKGAVTWFTASLQLHEIRRTVIHAFLRDNPGDYPDISVEEGRHIAKCWASVFSWVEGYLNRCRGIVTPCDPEDGRALEPILFRTTEPWRVIAESLEGESREAVSEAIAEPYGSAAPNRSGDLRYPKKDTLDKWAQSRGEDGNTASGSRGPLDYTLALCMATGSSGPVSWLAREHDGYLAWTGRVASTVMSQADLLRFWERTMVELSELDSMIARAHLDGEISSKELALLEKEWREVVDWMEGFLAEW